MRHSRLNCFLIIRFSAIGDILLTTPLIRSLRKRYPDAEINFLVKKQYSSLLKNNPHLNKILEFDPSEGKDFSKFISLIDPTSYDCLIDLQVNNRSLLLSLISGSVKTARFCHHRVRRFLLVKLGIDLYTKIKPVPIRFLEAVSKLDVEDDGAGLELNVEQRAVSSVKESLAAAGITGGNRYIVIAPGAGRTTKRWTVTGFAESGAHFIRQGYKIVLTGGLNDKEVCTQLINLLQTKDSVNRCGNFSIQETAALLKNADLVITNDTGVMHLSCAVQTPVTAIFGPTTRQLGFFPFRARAVVVEKKLNCRPCSYHGTDACPKGHFRCMEEITPEEVISAAEDLIN